MLSSQDLETLKNLVGEFDKPQLDNLFQNIEYYFHEKLSVFIPLYKYCDYAVSENHTHPAYSFIYNIKTNGGIVVEGKDIPSPSFGTPNICAFSPDLMHQEIINEGHSNYIAVMIDRNFFEQEWLKYPDAEIRELKAEFFQADETILFLLKLLMAEFKINTPGKENIISPLISQITHLLIRKILNLSNNHLSINNRFKIDELITYLHENIDSKITIDEMAGFVNLSTSHFSKIFKELTQKTAVEYLNFIRIEKSKRLLKLSTKNLTEIAFDCGFSSSSYFSHKFIEAVKITPGEYRAKFAGKES